MSKSSNLLDQAVEALSSLPGVGRKSALRLALNMLEWPTDKVDRFVQDLAAFRAGIGKCTNCGFMADEAQCEICKDGKRKQELLCVVEGIRDVLAIENTNHYFGRYHILGGVISPIDGVRPEDLSIDALLDRIKKEGVKEVILAIRSSIEGETTCFYLGRLLQPLGVTLSVISRGVSFGSELEYTDEITLGRSIEGRVPYEPNMMTS